MQPFLLSAGALFDPVTRTYTTGTGATETVPAGASQVLITMHGGGSSGAFRNQSTPGANGGGGAAYLAKTIAVTGGNTMTYTVGAGGAVRTTLGQNSGTASQVSGTVFGGSLTLVAGGGSGLNGGTASGGDTNTNGDGGVTGEPGVSNGAGGSAAPPGGGSGGSANGGNAGFPGGGGGGGNIPDQGGAGGGGRITFYYT